MVKNEHYVPRFYLRRFSNNDKIFAYDLENGNMFQTNINKIACNNYFYDINPTELKQELEVYHKIYNLPDEYFEKTSDDIQFIEKALSRLEDKFAVMLNKFEKDYSLLKDEEFLSTLFLFLRMQSIRTRSFRNGLENLATQTTQWLKSLKIKNVENYPLDLEPNEIAKLNQLKEIISLPSLYDKSKKFFGNYEFYVGVNNTNLNFIISDNPLLYFEIGFNDICFPVNPKLAIIMQVPEAKEEFKLCNIKPDENGIINLTNKEVLKYNVLQQNTNAKYLFGSKEALDTFNLCMIYVYVNKLITLEQDLNQ